MADIKLVGAVAIKVRPDARGFRGATQKAISKELAGVDGKVKIKVTADTAELAKEVKKAKEKAEKEQVTLRVGVDYDSLRAAQKQLDAAIKRTKLEALVVELDQKGIDDARAFLDSMIAESKVTMRITPDEKGFKEVLDRIAQIRREKIEKNISFEIDDASLDKEQAKYEKKLAKITKNVPVTFTYNTNRESIQKAIDAVNEELASLKVIEVTTKLNEKDLTAARKKLEAALAKQPVDLKIDYDDQESLKAARGRLKELLSEINARTLTVDFNEEAIRSELKRLDGMIEEEVKEERKIELPVHTTGLQLVARQLQFASRPRRVPFYVVVDAKSVAIAEGILRSLAGVNTLQSAGRGLETLITKFDTISLKAGAWGAAIGGLTDTLIYLLTQAFAIGDGMAEVVGLFATAPAALAAITAAAIITTMAFDNMKKALDGDAEAMAKLPEAAQAAVRALDGTWEAIQRPVQAAFWEAAGDSLVEFVEKVIPQLRDGLSGAADGMGRAFDEVIQSFIKIAVNGDLKRMFDNLEILFDKVGRSAGPLVDAFNVLGLRGSEFFPRFGDWVLDIVNRFRDWIVESERLGDINAWINDGVVSLKDMWHTAGAIIDQFKALARATGKVSNTGLDDFRRSMQHIAKVMLAEPFQSRMGTIFAGARTGASELNAGLKDLGRSFGEAASFTGELLTLLGRLGGLSLSGLSRTFSNLRFQTGVLDSLRGMSDMLRTMEPAFDRLGSVIGRVGSISAEVFRGLGPVANTALSILDDALGRVGDNLAKLAPDLLKLTNNLLNLSRGPIMLAVGALNAFLEVLNGLPTPLRDAAIAFGTFLLLRNQFGAFANALSGMWTKLTTIPVSSTAQMVSNAHGNFVKMTDGSLKEVIRLKDGTHRAMVGLSGVVTSQMAVAQTAVNKFDPGVISTRMTGVVGAVRNAVGRINGALALIGGIPGLALGGLGILLGAIGGNAARASQNIDDLNRSLDKTTGANTEETFAIIAKNISNVGEAGDAWANFWRGVIQNSKAGNETLDQLGMNVGTVARIVAGSQSEYDAFIGQMKTLAGMDLGKVADFMRGIKPADFSKMPLAPGDEFTTNTAQLDALEKAAKAARDLNLSPEQISGLGGSLKKLTGDIEEQRNAWAAAQVAQKLYADTMGVTTGRAQEIASLSRILGDTSRDAAGQIDAMRRSLDLLNNRGASEQEARINRQNDLQNAVENARNLASSIQQSRKVIFDQNGLISEQSKAGRDLFAILRDAADNVLIHAKGAYNSAIQNGETAEAAAAKAQAIVKAGETDLKAIADAAGLTVGELKAQWSTFFGDDWTLTATFTGTTEQFTFAKAEAERLGLEFNEKEFTAWLLANPDPAKVTTDQVTAYMRNYAVTTFKATLDALPAPAQAAIAQVLGKAREFANGDYQAVLDAWNQANPIVQGAINFIRQNYTNPAWMATISAAINTGSLASVEYALIQLTRPRTAVVNVTYADVGRDVAMASRVKAGSANGSIMDRFGKAVAGFAPKYFANGGIEKHVAQIASAHGRGPVRIWAEPETHGEAYIPLAVSKRPRSVSILGEVAKKFGYELNRRSDQQHYSSGAAGGSTVPTRSVTASVTVGTINTVDPQSAVKELRKLQRDELAVAGIN